ncbi:hypothetical protein NMG60_11016924 [Bertholletia excelsa]
MARPRPFFLRRCSRLFLHQLWHRWKTCYGCFNNGKEPAIQINNEEMIHGFQYSTGEGSTCSSEASLWQKNILMGGKCELPDFSGVIIYDAAGKVVSPAKAPRTLPWK